MFNYGFANFINKKIIDEKTPLNFNVDVVGGKNDRVEVIAEKPIYLFSHKNEKISVDLDFECTKILVAPINKGDVVGILHVYKDSVEIASIKVLANQNVEEKSYLDNVKDIYENWALI